MSYRTFLCVVLFMLALPAAAMAQPEHGPGQKPGPVLELPPNTPPTIEGLACTPGERCEEVSMCLLYPERDSSTLQVPCESVEEIQMEINRQIDEQTKTFTFWYWEFFLIVFVSAFVGPAAYDLIKRWRKRT